MLEELTTSHAIWNSDSRNMEGTESQSVDLVVTSPPYPMIEMWDQLFSDLDPEVMKAIAELDGAKAFHLMNEQLNLVWKEVARVVKNGGVVCINIGDATRNLGKSYQLYPSHTVISDFFRSHGFEELPSIIWKKAANSPNKFLGSGTLPVNAYVTLEHEFILIFRKNPRRKFTGDNEPERRKESAFFWEERNLWFSDVWENLKGTRQKLSMKGARERSGAFPLELAFRLINMYSIQGDTVLDPFAGTGSAALAAAASCRNSIGYEIDSELAEGARKAILESGNILNSLVEKRLEGHRSFVDIEAGKGRVFSHYNRMHGFPVVTKSETGIILRKVGDISIDGSGEKIKVSHLRP